eukprot:TRINITY_DN5425_c0_g1_i1.p1 TRINITY_DN5425_c0_g1~~TRINITY_DN5425_c0_g1_i1.p1  ORF type:complete len:218 (+),score=80.49 TRINITY_DN5425_c0_g1_i1:170-823(+)
MLYISKPNEEEVNRVLLEQKSKEFSYSPVGGSRDHRNREEFLRDPKYSSFNVDSHRIALGKGEEIFERAKLGLKGWKQFELGWVHLYYPDSPLQPGTDVCILAKSGAWNLSCCRVIYVFDEEIPESNLKRFGFAYGTLEQHVEKGEGRFTIEYNVNNQLVTFEILSYASHNTWFTRIVSPVARYIQDLFAKESLKALKDWVNLEGNVNDSNANVSIV